MRKTLASVRLGTEHGLGAEHGFTVIEVLVAATILVSALFGSFLMLDVSVKVARTDAAREGATNLAREVNEDARSLPYTSITSAGLVPALQAMPGLSNQSGGASWQIIRRGVTYTINVAETDVAATTSSAQQKQVVTSVSWTTSVTHTISQTVTITSAGQQVVLTSSQLHWANAPGSGWTGSTSQPTITSTSITAMTFSVVTPPNVSSVVWTVNGAVQSWAATYVATSSTTWTWTVTAPGWSLMNGTTYLPNGTYTIGAAAQNGNVTGPTMTMPVKLITSPPSAPTFLGAGFDSGLYSGGSPVSATAPPAVLEWTGSDPNIVGYQLSYNGAVICQTTLTNQANSLTYPASCGQSGHNVWCQTPTQCIDFTAPLPTASNLTYSVAPVYYDATNLQKTGTAAAVLLHGTGNTSYTLAPTTQNSGTNCPFTGPGDLSTSYVGAGTDTTSSTSGIAFCGPAFPSGQTIGTGGSAAAYVTTTSSAGNKTCTLTGTLSLNGGPSVQTTATVPAGVSTPTNYPLTWASTGNTSVAAGDKIDLQYTWSCGGGAALTLHYGSSSYASALTLNFASVLAKPSAPSNPSVTPNADGSATLTWTAAGGTVPINGYEIYRGGQNYNNRLYSDIASYFCTGTSCTWTDKTRTSSPQTYYIAAVGSTTLGSNEAESTMISAIG